jgi:hypothetical protein
MSVEAVTTAAAEVSTTELLQLATALAERPEPNIYISGLFTLAGVALAGMITAWLHELSASRAAKEQEQRERKAGTLVALRLARHLEAYAFQMLDVILSWNSVEWYEPNKWRCNWDDKPLYVHALEDWPDDIRWEDISSETLITAENFRDLTTRERIYLNGILFFNDGVDRHRENADMAATLAPMAWELAQSIRKTHGIAPIPHGDGEDIMRLSREHKEAQQKYEARMKASAIELDAL